MALVYLNGEFLPLEEARISPLDRGFTFGDGVYEVIPVYNHRVFRLREHLQRLDNSLRHIYMRNPMAPEEWADILERIVRENDGDDQSIYLQVTRGVSPRDHAFEDDLKPTVFVMSKPLLQPDNTAGANAIVREDIRWHLCHIKAITLLPSVLLRHEARQAGAKEAILVSSGQVTEGAASNVFVCSQGRIMTPPKSERLLPGITRDLIIELLQEVDLPCEETMVDEAALRNADEVWITSSTQEIVPIIRLDDRPVGQGKPGPIWHQAIRAYQQFKEDYCAGRI